MNKGYFYLILTAICWSVAGVLIRFNGQSGLMISVVGSGIAIIFNVFFHRQKICFNRLIIVTAICQFMSGITFTYANQLTTVGNAIVLQYTSMIFVLIYQSIDTKQIPKRRQLMIIGMVVFGIVLFFFDTLSVKGIFGNLFAVTSGAFFGLQFYLNTKKVADPYSSMLLSYVISVLFIGFVYKDFVNVLPIEWLVMILSGMIVVGLGGLFFAKGIERVNAFSANVICMSEVLFSPLWAFLIFHETVGSISLIGAIIIVFGIILNMFLEVEEEKKKKIFNLYINSRETGQTKIPFVQEYNLRNRLIE